MKENIMDILVSGLERTLPEEHDCGDDCAIGDTYDKKSEKCRKCMVAQKFRDMLLRKAAEEGNMEEFFNILELGKPTTIKVINEEE